MYHLTLLLLFACSDPAPPPDPAGLPWSVSVQPDGSTVAFGLSPAKSALQDAIDRFGNRLELAMFETDGERAVEVYYSKADLSGLEGRLILTVDAPPALLDEIAATGESKPTGNGSTRYEVPDPVAAKLSPLPLKAMLFAPAASLAEADLTSRFGEPESREAAGEDAVLLYPSRGIHITVPGSGRSLIQYVHPKDFAWLKAHLRER